LTTGVHHLLVGWKDWSGRLVRWVYMRSLPQPHPAGFGCSAQDAQSAGLTGREVSVADATGCVTVSWLATASTSRIDRTT
jgi:hypothetical protein